jgi:hypothetical protein
MDRAAQSATSRPLTVRSLIAIYPLPCYDIVWQRVILRLLHKLGADRALPNAATRPTIEKLSELGRYLGPFGVIERLVTIQTGRPIARVGITIAVSEADAVHL